MLDIMQLVVSVKISETALIMQQFILLLILYNEHLSYSTIQASYI